MTEARLKIGVDLPAGMVGCLAVLGVLLCVCSVRAAAQMSMSGHGAGMGMQMKNVPAPDKLPVAVKIDGIGNSYLAIKATPEAQAWFEQGLNLLHDFWDYESAKAFEQGIRADSNCAMCYWGLYQALMFREGKPNTYTDAALAGAVRLKNQASKEDRLYIDAAVADDGVETAPRAECKGDRRLAQVGEEVSPRSTGEDFSGNQPARWLRRSRRAEEGDAGGDCDPGGGVEGEAGRFGRQPLLDSRSGGGRASGTCAAQRYGAGESGARIGAYGAYAGAYLLSRWRLRTGRALVCGLDGGG